MATMEQLDTYLETEFSTDHWADEAIDYAQQLVGELDPGSWTTLEEIWSERPTTWQIRCAEVLSTGRPDRAVPLLVHMLEEANDNNVKVAAADSLRDFSPEHLIRHSSQDLIRKLQILASQSAGLEHPVVKALLNELLKVH